MILFMTVAEYTLLCAAVEEKALGRGEVVEIHETFSLTRHKVYRMKISTLNDGFRTDFKCNICGGIKCGRIRIIRYNKTN